MMLHSSKLALILFLDEALPKEAGYMEKGHRCNNKSTSLILTADRMNQPVRVVRTTAREP